MIELFNHFSTQFNSLDKDSISKLLIYSNYIKLSKFEDFKGRSEGEFRLVKNLFMIPSQMNKEKLKIFSDTFFASVTKLFEKTEDEKVNQVDLNLQILGHLLWAFTFKSFVEEGPWQEIQDFWEKLVHYQNPEVLEGLLQEINCQHEMKQRLLTKASDLSSEESRPY